MLTRARAEALGVSTLSDLEGRQVTLGLSHEFLERPDGLPGLRETYDLSAASVRGLEHDLGYTALTSGAIDVLDGYATEAKLATLDLVALRDDRGFSPPYEAAPLVRQDLFARAPAAAGALALLAGRLDASSMQELNAAV